MGGNTHGQSMYEQVDDTEPKPATITEKEATANKAAEEAAVKAKEDQAAGPPVA
jgi:hypothetical protein